jgi:hypothetical protein
MIKYFPKTGVFNYLAKSNPATGLTNPFQSHVVNSARVDAILLIKLTTATLARQKHAKSNTQIYGYSEE